MDKVKDYIFYNRRMLIIIALLLIGAIISVFVFTGITTSGEMFKEIIEILNQKGNNVLTLTATTAATSTLISAIPGDAGIPIANEIANLSSWLLIITCAIQLEKFLVITMGYVSFGILIPVACVSGIIYQFSKKDAFKKFAIKFLIFSIILFLLIPTSVGVTKIIDESVDELNGLYEQNYEDIIDEKEEKGFFAKIFDSIEKNTEEIIENAEQSLNKLVNEIAGLVVTSIVIPILVFMLFVWIVNTFMGSSIKITKPKKKLFYKKKNEVITSGKE